MLLMSPSPMLASVVALVCWTLLIEVWMLATRIPALSRKGISLKGRRGGRGVDLEGVIEAEVQWKAHNYNHLLEQPTIFYALVLAMTLMGQQQPINIGFAWGYVLLRIAHSLVQTTVNIVAIRLGLFLLSSLLLIGLAAQAAMVWFH